MSSELENKLRKILKEQGVAISDCESLMEIEGSDTEFMVPLESADAKRRPWARVKVQFQS